MGLLTLCIDSDNFAAGILSAAFRRATGDTDAAETTLARLRVLHPVRTRCYRGKIDRADRILQTPLREKPRRTMPRDGSHAMVIRGARLEIHGTIRPKLTARLQQGLRLARMCLRARGIVNVVLK